MNIDTHNKTVPSPLSRASEIKKKQKYLFQVRVQNSTTNYQHAR